MITIALLDKALQYLDAKKNYSHSKSKPDEFTPEEFDYLLAALKKLNQDDFADHTPPYDFRIAMKGKLALQESFFGLFKERPYERAEFRKSLGDSWKIVKSFAAFAEAVILIILAWLALKK